MTGANDAAASYQKNGFSSAVVVLPDFKKALKLPGYEVLAVNTDSRALPPYIARGKVYKAANWVKEQFEPVRFYKKIDSVLRGNTCEEISAIIDALNPDYVMVAPSFPGNNRSLENGWLLADGEPINALELFRNRCDYPVSLICKNRLDESKERLREWFFEQRESGARVFLADAKSQKDLAEIAELPRIFGENMVFCGSAGLAAELSFTKKQDNKCLSCTLPASKRQGLTLVVVGSMHHKTQSQLQTLQSRLELRTVCLDADLVASDCKAQIDRCTLLLRELANEGNQALLLRVSAGSETHGESTGAAGKKAMQITKALAGIVRRLHKHVKIKAIISSGGDTSLAVCSALGIQAIEIMTEIEIGVPVARVINQKAKADNDLLLITKSGGFGTSQVFINAIQYIETYPMQQRRKE